MWSRRLHSPHFCQKWVRRLSVRSSSSRLCQEERGHSPAVSTSTSPSEAIQPRSGVPRHPTQFVVFDTAKASKCPLTTARPNILTWYSCGPTVYDSAHIGHASSFIRQDVIRRLLQHYHKDLTVVQVMGMTDIDDKIILKARQTNSEWRSVSRHYEREFKEDLSRLGVSPPLLYTNVSDFIPQILQFVGNLVSFGYAYPVEDGSVYFDTQKYGDKYGIFGQTQEDVEDVPSSDTGGKKSPRDFAVWKGAKPDEPYWDSPWGSGKRGRPGWHIECSVMASQIFGPSLDVHTGGKDLIFPHHENEEAQCCAHFQSPQWTNHWLHMGHLHFKGDVKMSKSLGNTISIRQFLEQHSSQLLRLMCVISRYRKDLEYSQDNIDLAQTILNKLQTFSSDTRAILSGQKTVNMSSDMDGGLWEKLEHSKVQLNSALLNDFGTSEGIKIVTELISDFNRHFDSPGGVGTGSGTSMTSFELVMATKTFVQNFLDLVGLSQNEQIARTTEGSSSAVEVEPVLDKFVAFRNAVRSYSLAMDEPDKATRKEKMSQRKELIQACDGVRKELLEEYNVEIKDYGSKSSWRIIEKK